MSTDKQLSELRAGMYWWFSTLFIQEMKTEQWLAYRSDKTNDLLVSLSTSGLQTEVDTLHKAIDHFSRTDDPTLELAADYAQTFLRDNKTSALPYASSYLSDEGLLYQAPHQEMKNLLQRAGMAVSDSLAEPCDHIAIQLDYLGNLVLRGLNTDSSAQYEDNLQEELAFIDSQLMTWVPQFSRHASVVRDAVFYPAVTKLFEAYLKLDRDFILQTLARTETPSDNIIR